MKNETMENENVFIKKDKDVFFKVRKLDRYMTGHKGYIAGGVFKNIFNNEKFRDIDIFFENENDYNEGVLFYQKDSDNWFEKYDNKNAKCFKNKKNSVTVELVKSFFSTAEEMLNRFDFTVVKFAYIKEVNEENETEYKCLYHRYFFEDLILKKLVIDNVSSFPVNTLERTWKYKSYGFGLCRESKVKLVEMLQGVNSEDIGNSLYFGID